MDEESLNTLNMKFQLLIDALDENQAVSFTYFKPDETKASGAYVTATGIVKKVDDYERVITMMDGTKIPMDDVYSIESEVFRTLEM